MLCKNKYSYFYKIEVYQRVPVHQRNLSIDTNQFNNSDQQVLVHTSNLATQLQVSTNQVTLFYYFCVKDNYYNIKFNFVKGRFINSSSKS